MPTDTPPTTPSATDRHGPGWRRRRAVLLGLSLAAAIGAAAAGPVAAAPAAGCAATQSDWVELSVHEAAEAVYPYILPGHPWPTLADFEAEIATHDTDADGSVCVKQSWGDNLNPNSHWYRVGLELMGAPVVASSVRDNNDRAGSSG